MSNVKRALQLASVASMIYQFNMSNITILKSLGFEVDVVADFTNPGTITVATAETFKKSLLDMGVRVFDIEIPRSLNISKIVAAYKKLKRLFSSEHYDLIHCHSPIGGAICRLAARSERKKQTKVIYTAHGFHFYDGAPLKNWLVYYPIEKILSNYTDALITINKEDYQRALKKFHAEKTVYVPGVGIDTEKFVSSTSGRERTRTELGLEETDNMLLSVGELNENKNHGAVIKAIKGMKNITYVIAGIGEKEAELKKLAEENSVTLKLLGFRKDVVDLYSAADVYVLPSIREGLNVSVMEAMSCGLAVTCSRIRGNVDLVKEPLFSPKDVDEIKEAITTALDNKKEFGRKNIERIKSFDMLTVKKQITKLYQDICQLSTQE